MIQTGGTKEYSRVRRIGTLSHLVRVDQACDRTFELSFTTKPEDESSGVGLSTVRGTAVQGGGHIEVGYEPVQRTVRRLLKPPQPICTTLTPPRP